MKMSEISISEIYIPESYIRRRIDNSRVLVKIKKTSDSSALITRIENAWEAYDPDNILFEIDGRERLGTVDIFEDDNGTGYTIVLTVT